MSNLWAAALAELRSCRRLARTWVLVILAVILTLIVWLQTSVSHAFGSGTSPVIALANPKFAMFQISGTILLLFSIGIMFLSFDIRSRDIRDRIGEVLDSRPFTNVELIGGRLLGNVLIFAIPSAVVVLLMFVYGLIAEAFGLWLQGTFAWVSVFSFIVWDLFPNLAFYGALTIFLSLVLRFRLIVVVVMLAFLVGSTVLGQSLPYALAASLSSISGTAVLASEIAPEFFPVHTLINRLGLLLLTGGLVVLAAVVHPRKEDKGGTMIPLIAGLASLGLGILSIYGIAHALSLDSQKIEQWASVHADEQHHRGTDIESISGVIEINPRSKIKLDLSLVINSPAESLDREWLLSLNPGYRIRSIGINSVPLSVEEYSFENGLLRLPKSGIRSDSTTIEIVADGVPDQRFAYLDSTIDWTQLNATQVSMILLFGQRSYIFHSDMVVLLPGVSWIPSSGSAFGKQKWGQRPQDFFNLDVEIEFPRHWTIAGPGSVWNWKLGEFNSIRKVQSQS